MTAKSFIYFGADVPPMPKTRPLVDEYRMNEYCRTDVLATIQLHRLFRWQRLRRLAWQIVLAVSLMGLGFCGGFGVCLLLWAAGWQP